MTTLAAGLMAGTVQAAVFNGNGDTGFGGGVGNGSLTLTDDGTTVSGTFTRGTDNINDAIVIFIDSFSGGFTTTGSFNDQKDGLRKAISGVEGSNRSTLNFPSGFEPDYAIALKPTAGENFGGLWKLANGGNDSLNFVTSVSLSPTSSNNAANYTFSFGVSNIDLTPNSGATIGLLGTYIATSGYRSTEALPGNVSGTQGWNTFTGTATASYTIVPEPASLALLSLGIVGALRRRR